jgi:hypothetical protein
VKIDDSEFSKLVVLKEKPELSRLDVPRPEGLMLARNGELEAEFEEIKGVAGVEEDVCFKIYGSA